MCRRDGVRARDGGTGVWRFPDSEKGGNPGRGPASRWRKMCESFAVFSSFEALSYHKKERAKNFTFSPGWTPLPRLGPSVRGFTRIREVLFGQSKLKLVRGKVSVGVGRH